MTLPRLELDYHAPPRRRHALGLLLLALALGGTGMLVQHYREVQQGLERAQAAHALAGERRAPAPKKVVDDELRSAEAVVRQLALPWSAMVRTVEGAATPDVALLQMQPEARERLLRLTAEARSEQAMLAYLARLAAADSLADVHLASHQVLLEDPQRPIQFVVQARLKGAP
jgi:hypothetical protein